MNPRELTNIMFSPQWSGKLLHLFCSGAQEVVKLGIKTELVYFSLPFIFDEVCRDKLNRANIRSTLKSIFFSDKSLEVKNALLQKNDQISKYRKFVNRGLIYLSNITELKFEDYVTVGKITHYQNENVAIRDFCKSAYYFGVILAKENFKDIFVKLRVFDI